VADCGNHRIQHFGLGELNGTTIAGSGANETVDLNRPVGIILDADGNLFVSDMQNNRIQRFFLARNSCGKHYNENFQMKHRLIPQRHDFS
jgi:sugar lactone lactonase YvrE